MELPELGIRDSRLAEEVIEVLQSTDDKFDLAHRLVAIADDRIRNQTSRDAVDIAIERARTPNFSLSGKDLRKLKRLLLKAKEDLELIEKSGPANHCSPYHSSYLKARVEGCIDRIPKTVSELVLEKLENGKVRSGPPLTPYWMRLELSRIYGVLDLVRVEKSDKHFRHLQKTFEKIAKAIGSSGTS